MNMMGYIVIAMVVASAFAAVIFLLMTSPPKTKISLDAVCPAIGSEVILAVESNGGMNVSRCNGFPWLAEGGCDQACLRVPAMRAKCEKLWEEKIKALGPESTVLG